MKPVSRFQIDHHNYQGPRLHNDLNKMVQQTNDNFEAHQTAITAAASNITTLQSSLKTAIDRITALEAELAALS